MTGQEDFQSRFDSIMHRAEEELQREKERLEKKQKEFNKILLEFDHHADLIAEQIALPRLEYLASLFENASPPLAKEEDNYRHRIVLRFLHSDHYPCLADITLLMVHGETPGFLKVKFDYIILPAYLVKRYKFGEELQVPLVAPPSAEGYSMVGEFIQTCLENFLEEYLKVRQN